jgi:hypothetical protein
MLFLGWFFLTSLGLAFDLGYLFEGATGFLNGGDRVFAGALELDRNFFGYLAFDDQLDLDVGEVRPALATVKLSTVLLLNSSS